MKIDEIVPGCIGLLLCGIPSILLLRLCWFAWTSRSWPTSEGVITCSKFIPRKRRPGQACYDIRYVYTVHGAEYRGDRINFGGSLNFNIDDTRKVVDRYPVGKSVTVLYHPDHPEIATLERRLSGFVWFWLATGLFVIGSIAGALAGWWK